MTTVLLAHEKHGPGIFATALACLRERVAHDYWYSDEEMAEARDIVARQDEDAADSFLDRRSDHEYENVEWVEVVE